MPSTQKLYDQVVRISEDFLGPAGERFIRRQIETHLMIKPEELQPRHVPKLVDWMRLMFAMITNDSKIVDTFADQLLGLAKTKPTKSASRTR